MKIYTPSNQHKSRNSSRLSRRRENKYEMDKVSLSFYRRNIDAIFWKTTRNGTNRISISVVIVSGVLVVEAWLRLNFREASKRVCFRSTPDFLPARNANWIIKRPCPHSCRFQRKLPFLLFFFLTINQNATTSFTPSHPKLSIRSSIEIHRYCFLSLPHFPRHPSTNRDIATLPPFPHGNSDRAVRNPFCPQYGTPNKVIIAFASSLSSVTHPRPSLEFC